MNREITRPRLLYDPVSEMCDIYSIDNGELFQFDRSAKVIEQLHPSPEEAGCQVGLDFVEQPSLQALLCNACTDDIDVLIPCSFLRLFDGTLDSIRDEGEGRTWINPFLRDCMGHD